MNNSIPHDIEKKILIEELRDHPKTNKDNHIRII